MDHIGGVMVSMLLWTTSVVYRVMVSMLHLSVVNCVFKSCQTKDNELVFAASVVSMQY